MVESHFLRSQRKRAHDFVEPGPTRDRPQLPATGKAGRNLPAAIGVGVGLAIIVLLCLFFVRPVFVIFAAITVCMALQELAGALARIDLRIALPPLWIGSVGILVCAYFLGPEAMLAALFLTIMCAVIWRLLDGAGQGALRDCMASTFAITYVTFLAGFAILILARSYDAWPVITFIAVTCSNDIGGYVAGVLFGKHPMAPSVSPKKSWEGFIGSVVFAVGVAVIMMTIMNTQWWYGVILGVLTAIFATAGDLSESLLKRDLGLKDMGNILPGHGGIMDRLDSLLIVAPMCYLVLFIALKWWLV